MSDTAVAVDPEALPEAADSPPPPGRRYTFATASRAVQLARLAIAGPKGSGKTLTALEIARALGGRIVVIDTQRGHAALYAGEFQFEMVTLNRFHPDTLVDVIAHAVREGFDTIVVDNVSSWWSGPAGILEQVDQNTRPGAGGSGWKHVRPMERRMLTALQGAPAHVIVTVRVKTEILAHHDESGAIGAATVGLKWEQREGFEYDWALAGVLSMDNTLTLTAADRELHGLQVPKPDAAFGARIKRWLEDGAPVEPLADFAERALAQLDWMLANGATVEDVSPLAQSIRDRAAEGFPFFDDRGRNFLLGDRLDNLRAKFSQHD